LYIEFIDLIEKDFLNHFFLGLISFFVFQLVVFSCLQDLVEHLIFVEVNLEQLIVAL